MHAVIAISPKGTEMVASVHPTESEAREELGRQVERRGGLWTFVVRAVLAAQERQQHPNL